MREFVGRFSDRLLGLIVPKTVAQAKYCLACSVISNNCYVTWQHELNCLNAQQGWINIGCYDHCP
jgi:hypothetical protein